MDSRGLSTFGLTAALALAIAVTCPACKKRSSDKNPAPLDPLVITTTSLTGALVGVPYSFTLTATGGAVPHTWMVVSGALPAGITLAPNGTLSGTPSASGLSTFTVQVSDPRTPPATDTATFDLDVRSTLAIQTTSLPDAYVGTPYAFTVVATGGILPLSWSLTGGTLPSGITFSASGDLAGTATAPEWASLTFEVSDSQVPPATVSATLDFFVRTPPGPNSPPTVSVFDPTGDQRGLVDLSYRLLDNEGDPVTVTVEYSTDLGFSYLPATSGPAGEGPGPFTTTPVAAIHVFCWDSVADFGTTLVPTVRLRVTAMDAEVGLPSSTVDFRLDNTPDLGIFVEVLARQETERMDHTATLLDDGRVFIAGGYGVGNVVLGTAETFDPITGRFTYVAPLMTTPRAGHTATLLPDGTVLIAGGIPSILAVELDTAEIFDPVAVTFTATGSMSEARVGHAAVATSTGAYITGGSNTPGPTYLDRAERYDPVAGTFGVVPGSFFRPRAEHTATLLQSGRIFMAGGTGEMGVNTEEFDPATGTSPATEGLACCDEIIWHAASAIPDGTVLLTGGAPGWGVVSINDAYDYGFLYTPSAPSGSRLSDVGPMVSSRRRHTSTYLPLGDVLIAGGRTNALSITADAELYRVSSPGFKNTSAPMTIPRMRHAAVLLNDGRVLITGGTTDGNDPVRMAERYHP